MSFDGRLTTQAPAEDLALNLGLEFPDVLHFYMEVTGRDQCELRFRAARGIWLVGEWAGPTAPEGIVAVNAAMISEARIEKHGGDDECQ